MTLDEFKNAKNRQIERDKIFKHIEDVADAEYYGKLGNPLKTYDKMWQFITDKAREKAVNGCACIDDETVYAWVDEYVGREEKAEELQKEEQKPAAKTDDAPKAEKPLYHNAKQQHKEKKLIRLEETPAAEEPADAENTKEESAQEEKTTAKMETQQMTFDF